MNTYKDICDYFHHHNCVKQSEVNFLNQIANPDEFRTEFLAVYEKWKMRKRIKDNKEQRKEEEAEAKERAEIRRYLLRTGPAIKKELQGKPVGRQIAIRNNWITFYNAYGLKNFYDDIYKTVKNEA